MFVWKTRRQHPWLSVISAHPGDFLTAFKRLTILVTLLFNNMTVVILLLDQDLKLPLASPEFSRVILTTFLAFPIPFIISWILQRAPPLYFYIDLSEDFPLYGFLPLVLAIVSDADTAVKDQKIIDEYELEKKNNLIKEHEARRRKSQRQHLQQRHRMLEEVLSMPAHVV
mmetsp:Transcript_3854/g.6088  ORF Transcript_3854/g.6088 Transcript_3854/m.6088 type:complete len:170 (+) Transcript_3854:82-591(+)